MLKPKKLTQNLAQMLSGAVPGTLGKQVHAYTRDEVLSRNLENRTGWARHLPLVYNAERMFGISYAQSGRKGVFSLHEKRSKATAALMELAACVPYAFAIYEGAQGDYTKAAGLALLGIAGRTIAKYGLDKVHSPAKQQIALYQDRPAYVTLNRPDLEYEDPLSDMYRCQR